MSATETSATLYELLGVSPSATPEEIKAAYRRLLKIAHPDAGGTSALFRQVQYAWEVLSDPTRRALYDRTSAGAGSQTYEPPPPTAPDQEPTGQRRNDGPFSEPGEPPSSSPFDSRSAEGDGREAAQQRVAAARWGWRRMLSESPLTHATIVASLALLVFWQGVGTGAARGTAAWMASQGRQMLALGAVVVAGALDLAAHLARTRLALWEARILRGRRPAWPVLWLANLAIELLAGAGALWAAARAVSGTVLR